MHHTKAAEFGHESSNRENGWVIYGLEIVLAASQQPIPGSFPVAR
jgi:hypothetical protein